MFRVLILAVSMSLCVEGQMQVSPAPAPGVKKVHVTNLPPETATVTCDPACKAGKVTAGAADVTFKGGLTGQALQIYAKDRNGAQLNSENWELPIRRGGGRATAWSLEVSAPAGGKTITVTPAGAGAPANGTISVSVGGGTAVACTIGATAPAGCTPASGGGYELTSSANLVLGQHVTATLVTSPGAPPTVWNGYVGAAAKGGLGIEFSPFPKDTQTKIAGYFTGADASKVQTVFIEVRAGNDVVQGPFTATVQNNTFSYSGSGLSLAEGESVYVHAWEDKDKHIGDSGEVKFPNQQNQPAVTSLYDMGRFKSYFSVGGELDGSSGSLSTATEFAGVNMDSNIYTSGNETSDCFTGTGHAYRSTNADCNENIQRFMINAYLEAQLTQIPISSSSSNGSGGNSTKPTTGTGGSSASFEKTAAASNGSGTGGNSTTGSGTSSTIDVTKAKGAYVVGGVYIPWLPAFAQWRFRGQRNAFFIGPLANYGFQVPGKTPAGTPNFNAFRSYSGGFRFGHYRMTVRMKHTAPELLSYLDVTWGKWQDFREAVTGNRGTRLDVAGRYKIPYTVLFIGFDANTGPGGSDIRLLAGTRVDVSTILGKLLPSAN